MDYAAIPAMNWSSLKHLDVSPLLFRWRVDHPREDTPALAFGRAFHIALLEPERFDSAYVVEPEWGDLRTKAAKDARAAWRADHPAQTPLSAEDGDRIASMVAALRGNRHATAALRGAVEQILTWQDAPTGLACKGRLDTLGRRVVDVKTTRDPAPFAFGRDAGRYLYHGQLAWYDAGAEAAGHHLEGPPLIVAVQHAPPWDVAVYELGADALEAGRALYRRLLDTFAACTAANWWPGVSPEVSPLRLPAWCMSPGPSIPDTEEF